MEIILKDPARRYAIGLLIEDKKYHVTTINLAFDSIVKLEQENRVRGIEGWNKVIRENCESLLKIESQIAMLYKE